MKAEGGGGGGIGNSGGGRRRRGSQCKQTPDAGKYVSYIAVYYEHPSLINFRNLIRGSEGT